MIEIFQHFEMSTLRECLNNLADDNYKIISVMFIHTGEYSIPHYQIIVKKQNGKQV